MNEKFTHRENITFMDELKQIRYDVFVLGKFWQRKTEYIHNEQEYFKRKLNGK